MREREMRKAAAGIIDEIHDKLGENTPFITCIFTQRVGGVVGINGNYGQVGQMLDTILQSVTDDEIRTNLIAGLKYCNEQRIAAKANNNTVH